MPIQLTIKMQYIHKIKIYENQENIFFIGEDNIHKTNHYISFKKLNFTNENILEYSKLTLKDIIQECDKKYHKTSLRDLLVILGNKGKMKKVLHKITDFFCIFGFIKFYFGYYAIVASDCTQIGKIGRNIIYRVDKLQYIPLFSYDIPDKNSFLFLENKYIDLFKSFALTKQLYFSYTYDLSKTVQRNFIENLKNELIPHYKQKFQNKKGKLSFKKLNSYYFMWNYYHIKEFYNCILNKGWICYFIYGFFEQVECNTFGLRFLITVLARRSRHYAGTRYLKRGINNNGNVANEVETEQILEELSTTFSDRPIISSFIHIRGSVPIYWFQDHNSILSNPIIKVKETDFRFDATLRHFSTLVERYGHPCIVCNLTKKEELNRKQETLLNEFYKQGIDYINLLMNDNKDKILYYHYDLKKERQQPKYYKKYYDHSIKFVGKTNFFCFIPEVRQKNLYRLSLQNGVIRTNCVDCIDRTNVYQKIIGLAVLVLQLRKMGVNANFPENEEEIYGVLGEIYKRMGHELSKQYAGSLAHKQNIKDTQPGFGVIDKFIEIFNTFQRYFNNSFYDQHKQSAINLFLGKYKVNVGLPQIWEMKSDELLHFKKKLEDVNYHSFDKFYNRYIISNLLYDVSNCNFLSNKGKIVYMEKIFFNPYNIFLKEKKEKKSDIKNSICEYKKNNEKIDEKSNLYDYLFDYGDYVKYKFSNFSEFEVEFNYEINLPMFYYIDVKRNIPIRNFYDFNFNDNKNFNNSLYYKYQNSTFTNSNYNIRKKPPIINDFYLEKAENDGNENIKKIRNSLMNKQSYNSNKVYNTANKHKKGTNVLNHMKIFTKLKKDSKIKNKSNSIPIKRPEIQFKISSFVLDESDIDSINSFVYPNLKNNEFEVLDDFTLETFKSNLSEGQNKEWMNLNDKFTKENAFNFYYEKNNKNKKETIDDGILFYDAEEKCFFKDYDYNKNLDINADSKINLQVIPLSIVDEYFNKI